jgi:DNA helicase II / ATP-dependent DNA helicase PcrA
MKLNKSQEQAVLHGKGPLLIVAGAGTGKTTVLTERIKHLIEKRGVDPHHIFAATFTEKAAEEMLTRLDTVMPLGYQEPWLGTYHGLCDRLLRLEGLEIGLNSSFTLMTQTDQWLFIRQHLFDFDLNYYRPLGNPAKFISALMKYFSRLTDEDVDVKEVQQSAAKKLKSAVTEEEQVEAQRQQELAAAFAHYNQLKHDHDKLDFGDLITLTLKLFRTRPNICLKYRDQFEHVLVDEFQDTNYAQFELIKLLAPRNTNPNLTICADDDQAIFRFRGASVANILMFKDTYPDAAAAVLVDNYRSTQPILNSSYQSIINNNPDRLEAKLGIDKKLQSHLPDNPLESPAIYHFATIDEEVEWTVNKIYELVTKHGLTYKDIAVITRANAHLEPYVLALKNAGLPYQLITNRGLYDQDEIKTILNLLKVLADPHDSIALFQLLLSPTFNLQSSQLLDLMSLAHQHSTSLWVQLEASKNTDHQQIIKLLDSFRATAANKRITQLVYTSLTNFNILNSSPKKSL